jgi:exodeoxyribonuclease V beta subunit
VLQYLVYTLALHRYLTLRLPGYRYDDHFGGVYYLFVRGMHPEHAPGTGVFFDRPDQGLIQRLSSLLSDPGQKP